MISKDSYITSGCDLTPKGNTDSFTWKPRCFVVDNWTHANEIIGVLNEAIEAIREKGYLSHPDVMISTTILKDISEQLQEYAGKPFVRMIDADDEYTWSRFSNNWKTNNDE
jgi:hypothetical protein